MALVIEDGSIVLTANSFVDTAYASSYFADRGLAAWAGTESQMESALIRGGQYLNGLNWLGNKVNMRQVMAWPRYGVPADDGDGPAYPGAIYYAAAGFYSLYWDNNEIPEIIKQAQCEAALRYLSGTDMMPDLERGGLVLTERVGPVEQQYSQAAPGTTRFTAIEAMLRPFLRCPGNTEVVRG